jgi:hypothetical protein
MLVLIMALLAAFWKVSLHAHMDNDTTVTWHRLLADGWATTIVTASTAFLRIIVASQAGLFTSMVAATILEKLGAPLLDVAFYSTTRVTRSLPYILLLQRSTQFCTWKSSILHLLVVIELLATTASQFSSLLLLLDFSNTNIRSSVQSLLVRSTNGSPI